MNPDALGPAYDAVEEAENLKEAGFEDKQAKAIARSIRKSAYASRNDLVTKADFAALESQFNTLRSDVKADIAELRSTLYRALWIQGAGIVALVAALRFVPLA